jgi:hypothetical protein
MLGLAEKIKNLASLLAELLFLPCPIRTANARVPPKSSSCSLCPRWLNKKALGYMI